MQDGATPKQRSKLDELGITYDTRITKAEASRLITEAIANRKKIDTDALKAQHPLEQVVEQFAHQEVGRDRKIFAPWRAESTPSVHIYEDGGWKDYGDGTSGDIFDLIGRIKFADYDRHVHFIEVVDALGDLGIKPLSKPLAPTKPKPPKAKTTIQLEQIMTWADNLPLEHRHYWHSRGLTHNTIDRFLLGFDGKRLTIPALYRGIPFAVKRRITASDWDNAKVRFDAALAPYRAAHPSLEDKEIVAMMRAEVKAANPLWTGDQLRAVLPSMPPKYVGLDGDTPGIFNSDVLPSASTVVICEGELDCMLMDQAGYSAVTSTAGAGSWKPEWARFFVHCPTVYLLFDNDQAGRDGLRKVHAMLRRAKPLFLPEGIKDVGELWEHGVLDTWLQENVK